MPSEHKLRKLAGIRPVEDQVDGYRGLHQAEAANRGTAGITKPQLPRRGFQHLFRRARRYHAMLESDEAESMESIARAEGISSTRVRQLLMLLQLPPLVLEQLDVPIRQLNLNITEKELRRIATMTDPETQSRFWRSRIRTTRRTSPKRARQQHP